MSKNENKAALPNFSSEVGKILSESTVQNMNKRYRKGYRPRQDIMYIHVVFMVFEEVC